MEPLVSICCITYNHAAFIREAIDGFLMQKVNFSMEIIVHDDASDDGTAEIIREYAGQHPGVFIPVLQETNQYSRGIKPLPAYVLPRARGKYIALCEGDDYWTDPDKLQKQVDFLENNPSYVVCSHKTAVLNTFDGTMDKEIPSIGQDTTFGLKEYIYANMTATCSLLFRREFMIPPEQWPDGLPFRDWYLVLGLLNGKDKRMMVLADNMGVYRIHSGGVHGKYHKDSEGLIVAYTEHVKFFELLEKESFFDKEYKKTVTDKKIQTHKIISRLCKQNRFYAKWFLHRLMAYYYLIIIKTNG